MKENLMNWGIPALQTVLSSATVFYLLITGMLPLKLLFLVSGVLGGLLLVVLVLVGIGVGIKNKVVRLLGNILAAVICCVLIVALSYVHKVASTLLVAENHTNSPVAIEVITNLRHKLIGSLSIVVTKFHTTDTYRTAQVNLSIHSHCHSGNEQSHQNLFHVVFPFFF